MESITAVSSVKPGVGQEIMAALQDQLARYTELANTLSAQARQDYVALQSALSSGDVSNAEAALVRLEADTAPKISSPLSIANSAPSPVLAPSDNVAGPNAFAPPAQKLNATA